MNLSKGRVPSYIFGVNVGLSNSGVLSMDYTFVANWRITKKVMELLTAGYFSMDYTREAKMANYKKLIIE